MGQETRERGGREHSRTVSLDTFRGCLLGGAVGDALGAPVEFLDRESIRRQFGPGGIRQYVEAYGRLGAITDDTQMSLFTAEGLLRGWVRGREKGLSTYTGTTHHAYLRWVRTQGEAPRTNVGTDGWLYAQPELHHCRAPGNTCLTALRQAQAFGQFPRNDSKGCGGVMRVAPVGLFLARAPWNPDPMEAFDLAVELAALTHGHPTGQLAAGVLAQLIFELARGEPLNSALDGATDYLSRQPRAEETLRALDAARELAAGGGAPASLLPRLGQGWIAEEALGMGVYCALVAEGFADGVILAVNHSGDSDSTGAIAGHLLGMIHGPAAIPEGWLAPLELREVIEIIAEDLYRYRAWPETEAGQERARQRYPGW